MKNLTDVLYDFLNDSCCERLGDDAMDMQGRWASLAGVLASGGWFLSCVLLCASLLILPLPPTSPSKAGSRNPPPTLPPLLIQLHTVSKMTAYGERLGDDVMGVQGRRASLAGVLAGGIGFVSCVLLCSSLLMSMLLCCILLLLVDLTQVLWGLSRHLGSLTGATWVSFDFNVSGSFYWD